VFVVLLFACKPDPSGQALELPHHWAEVGEVVAADAFGGDDHSAWTALPDGFVVDGVARDRGDLPPGTVRWIDATEGLVLAHINGKGLYRTVDAGDTWVAASEGFAAPTLALFNPLAVPAPFDLHRQGDRLWLAAAGGLFYSDDEASTWDLADTGGSGSFNLLFTGVDVQEQTVFASALLPESIIPSDFAGLLAGTLFRSDDGGTTWTEDGFTLSSDHVADVAMAEDGTVHVATMDQGVLTQSDGAWTPAGGPSDAASLAFVGDTLVVASAGRGLWSRHDDTWFASGEHGALGLAGSRAMTADGQEWSIVPGPGSEAVDAGGTVHIALSFHVNYYHSYRGNEPTDDGYGVDIDVIRNTLDWLDAHPEVHADWDSDNAFTTDDWMVVDSPDILERISARVAAGTDDVRLMSWNNGAMASSSRAEFDEALARAKTSNEAAFGAWVPGVQPQENMFDPDHLGWYADAGLEWITLFNSATGFTALRGNVDLSGRAAFGPVTLTDPELGRSLVAVPVYHHADVLDHGGLTGWARQLSATYAEDTLLVVHFDADSESWERFDRELDALSAVDGVVFTNIADYVASHEPVAEVSIAADLADGTGDGFQSWAEKDFNHDVFTKVVAARAAAERAEHLGGDPSGALDTRLLALSTTNYGLAAPTLHDDRVADATAYADTALALAEAALGDVLPTPDPGEIVVVQPRQAAGPALLEVSVAVPSDWTGPQPLWAQDASGTDLPITGELIDGELRLSLVAEVSPGTSSLSWGYGGGPDVGTVPEAPDLASLAAPFTECDGATESGARGAEDTTIDKGGLFSERRTEWTLASCGGDGTVTWQQRAYQGLPGVVLAIDAALGGDEIIDDLQSVALSPLVCDGGVTELSWRSFGGTSRTRPARAPMETWNAASADGWAAVSCGDGSALVIAHRVQERSSMGFLPIRNEGGEAVLAPLGTLWGDSPWHHARRTGGLGIGDLIVPVVGSQFSPAAPDWGAADVTYRLLVGDDIDEDVRDLFAHPPLVVAGP